MDSPARHHRHTYGEYLALEEHANVRHEFFDGEIYAMAGGTPEHAAVCVNVWTRSEIRSGSIRLMSIDCTLEVADVYRDELAPR